MKVYVFCDEDCKHEGMTKEEIFSLISQAAEGKLEFDSEAAFITKVKEMNKGGFVRFWVGTQAEYNALGEELKKEAFCIITDDSTRADIEAAFQRIAQHLDDVDTALMQNEEVVAGLNEKLAKKSDVSHTHHEYVEQVLEALPNAKTYTTAGEALFYNVTVFVVGVRVATVTIDSSLILDTEQSYDFHLASVEDGFVYLNAVKNSNGTITFSAESTISDFNPTIAHIAGYR